MRDDVIEYWIGGYNSHGTSTCPYSTPRSQGLLEVVVEAQEQQHEIINRGRLLLHHSCEGHYDLGHAQFILSNTRQYTPQMVAQINARGFKAQEGTKRKSNL